MSFLDNMITWASKDYNSLEDLRRKRLLACDLLTGIGGLSVPEALKLAGVTKEDVEKIKKNRHIKPICRCRNSSNSIER